MRDTKLLFDEYPLVVNPQLAGKIGLGEAIVLQQVHYWVTLNAAAGRNLRDGYHWTYNTFKEWQKQFPFWSVRTIKTIVANLERTGLLVPANYNKMRQDRTKWYRINHDACTLQGAKLAPVEGSISTLQDEAPAPPLPETTEETTAKTTAKTTTPAKEKEDKKKYGLFNNVLLLDGEVCKLMESFGETKCNEMIESMSAGIASKGYRYKSHYAAILNWHRRDGEKTEKALCLRPQDNPDPDKFIKGKYGHMVRRR